MKKPSLNPIFDETKKRWRLAVPAAYTNTGKRRNWYFATKQEAKHEADLLKNNVKKYGMTAVRLTAAEAEEADRAFVLLKETGATLTEAVNRFVEEWRTKKASIKLADAWQEYKTDRLDLLSDAYQKDLDRAQAVIDLLGNKLLCDITSEDILLALRKTSTSLTRQYINVRTISPLWKWAVKKEKPWAMTKNPCTAARARIHEETKANVKKAGKRRVDYLTPEEVLTVLATCADHRKNEELNKNYRVDCSKGLAAFVLMLFAGLRPIEEINLMRWEDIDLEEAELETPLEPKTGARCVQLSANCIAWLERIPKKKRKGLVIPADWKRIRQCVRKLSGISQRQQDVLRHTFGTYHFKAHKDLNLTAMEMGNSPEIARRNYINKAATHKEAVDFWNILPPGATTAIRSVKSA